MKLKKHLLIAAMIAGTLALVTACGGKKEEPAAAAETVAETAAETEKASETEKETEAVTAEESAAEEEAKAESAESSDAGKYVIYEYEGNGNKVSHETLVAAGMGDTYLKLNPDGTGQLMLFQSLLDITWVPGEVTVYGTSKYTYEIEGDTLYLDMQGVYYTMKKEGGASSGDKTASGKTVSGKTVSGKTAASGDPYINDGTIEGVYKLYGFMGMTLEAFADMMETTPEKAAEYMMIELKSGGKAVFTTDGDADEIGYTLDGDALTMEAEGEKLEATLKNGLLRFEMEGAEVVLARLTDAAFTESDSATHETGTDASVWIGQYTKFVGDDDSAKNEDDEFTLKLYNDGTGEHHRDDLDIDCTWTQEGSDFTMQESFMGMTIDYTGTLNGDDLVLYNGDPDDDLTCEYVYVRKGGTGAEQPAAKASEAKTGFGTPAGVASGDGIVSEETLQKGYVWMNKVAKDIFGTTYEGLAEYFGVDGAFDKEEYSEHMGRNKRYYKWISEDDPNHFIYVNFDEKDAEGAPGVYTISSFNSSGFTSYEAEAKYLDVVQAEASEADKAAAANMKMKDFSVDIYPWSEKEDHVTVSMEIPESGWAYDEKKDHLVENEDVETFGAGFIQFELEKDIEKFDFYKDKFENYKDIDDREIGGVTFVGRTYKNIGYDWTEYIAQLDDDHAMSIGIVRVDISDGSMGDKILNSIAFK